MLLTDFLNDLLTTGAVTLAGEPVPFSDDDRLLARELLRRYHADDAQELPGTAPAYDEAAAEWAASLLYHTALLALVRTLDEQAVATLLPDFPHSQTPEAVYSADLTLRYLPDWLSLAKGLAPGDSLVSRLHALARQWPLSFVPGEPAEPAAEAVVLGHPALRQLYVDRIIRARDRVRATQPALAELVRAALGQHTATLWPEFASFTFAS